MTESESGSGIGYGCSLSVYVSLSWGGVLQFIEHDGKWCLTLHFGIFKGIDGGTFALICGTKFERS